MSPKRRKRTCEWFAYLPPVVSNAPVEFVAHLADSAICTTIALLWAKRSRLDLGLSTPAFREAEPWVLLYILWSTAEWAIMVFFPTEVDPGWLTAMSQLSLAEELMVFALLAPISEELLFRGAMFAALLRRWGIWVAAVVPSLIWGFLNVGYEWWLVASITGSGVLLAMVRWKGGSLYLPVSLHAVGNLLVTLNNRGLFGPIG